MATHLLFMATDQNPNDENGKPESSSKQRGRKPGKNQSQKKPPQRGMGVAQLEKLRLQDRWKKLTETNQFQSQFVPITDPLNGVPLQYSKLGMANFGPIIGTTTSGGGGGGGGGDMVMVNPYGIGAMDQRVYVETNVYENSKELSSMPKLQCVSDCCNNCFKKKRINGDEMSQLNGYFSTKTFDEGVGVLAIHKKGNSMAGSVLEYEFFPRKNGRSNNYEESEAEEGGVGVNSDSNSIDLSLKLSF